MGEYFTQRTGNGNVDFVCKAGVMDDWRYVRRSEAQAWAPHDAGADTNVREALQDPLTLWRFPWPDEDDGVIDGKFNVDRASRRDMFRHLDVPVTADLLRTLPHQHDICVSMSPGAGNAATGGGYNCNVFLPCPFGTRAEIYEGKTAILRNTGFTPLLRIVGERYDQAGNARTIFACAWCGSLSSPSQALIEEVRTYLNTQGWGQIAERVRGKGER